VGFVWWILIAIGVVIALALAIVVGALVSAIRLEGRADARGAAGRGRWGVIGFAIDTVERVVVIRLLGIRIVRASLGGSEQGDDEKPPRRAPRPRREHRVRLSLAAYRRLARTALRELRRMARHLHVDRLRLDAVVASPDPSLTGEAFGMGSALVGVIRSIWPSADVRLGVDFTSTTPRGAAELAVWFRPVRFVPGAARVGWAVWRERRRSRRAA
jgi:hypothetical protein